MARPRPTPSRPRLASPPGARAPRFCADCGTELAPSLLSCPSCHRLLHRDELQRLASEADAAVSAGDPRTALERWRRAFELLPAGSQQARAVSARIAALSARVDEAAAAGPAPPAAARGVSWGKAGSLAAAAAFLIWKFKFAFVFLLTKAKFLVLGLGKASTAFSMLLSLGVYWTVWGWKFALGIVLSLYVHEMGHVGALRRFGIAATAPMFIPGLGALVRLNQALHSPREEARVGLAGPIWGLGTAVVLYAASVLAAEPLLAAIARTGAWINLFNLLPVWQLDGSRGFQALSATQRWIAVAVIGGTWALTGEGLLALLLVVAGVRAFRARAEGGAGDTTALIQYVGLVIALSLLATIGVNVPGAAP